MIHPENADRIFPTSHVGDLSKFPASTALVLGPDTLHTASQDLAKEIDVPKESLEGREVRILSQEHDLWSQWGALRG